MAFNRNKSLAKAQKLLQKGKIEDAISEYSVVVDHDPSDIRTLLKIGDLHAKLGNIDAATETYGRVGEHYAKDGFFLKAVAVFKQILKLDPGLIRIYVRLAELYQHLGLNSEAMKQYQIIVRHYETQGLKKESLDILKKMSDLEPDNVASRLKLAELYAKEGHNQDAMAQFTGVAEDLKKKNNLQDLARVYEKMDAATILDEAQKLELIGIYLDTGEPKRALSSLQALFQKDPKNLPVLELLARAFTDLSQPEKAKSVYTEMINLSNERGLLEDRDRLTAKLRALGVISAAQSVVTGVPNPVAPSPPVETPSEAPQESAVKAQKPVEKVLEEVSVFLQYGLLGKACDALTQASVSMPANETIRKKLVEAYRQVGDFGELDGALKKSLESAQLLGLSDAEAAIQCEIDAIGSWEDQEGAAGVEVLAEPEEQESGGADLLVDGDDLNAVFDDSDEQEPQDELSGEKTSMEPRAEEPELVIDDKHEDASIELSFAEEELPEALDFSEEPVPEEKVEEKKEVELSPDLIAEMELPDVPSASAVPFDFDAEIPEVEQGSKEPDVAPEIELTNIVLEPEVAEVEPSPVAEEVIKEPALEEPIVEELAIEEPVLEEAPVEIALEESPMELEIEAPVLEEPKVEKPEAPVLKEPKIEEPEVAEPVDLEPKKVEVEEPVEQKLTPVEAVSHEPDVSEPIAAAPEPTEDEYASDMEEAEFFVSQGLLEEAQEVCESILAKRSDYGPAIAKLAELRGVQPQPSVQPIQSSQEPERRKAPREKPPVLEPEPVEPVEAREEPKVLSESDSLFDLSEELEEEIRELESDLASPKTPADDNYLSPEEVISEFKKGVSRTVAKDDFATHYNLGIAYKEMGLLDEAVNEFQLAGEDPDRSADSSSMIGLCLIAKKEFSSAITVYRKALAQISPQSFEALGLSYELAEAYLGSGNVTEAYKLFARVADVDPTFRDCRRRAKELELDFAGAAPPASGPEKPDDAQEGEEEDENSVVKIQGKKNKISYI